MNKSLLNESRLITANFNDARQLKIPQEMPTLIFLASETVSETDGWVSMHEALIADVNHADIVILDGEHYLHHTQSKEMARCLNEFLSV